MPSPLFDQFKHLHVVHKLMVQIQAALDIRDKTLAEYVLQLAKGS